MRPDRYVVPLAQQGRRANVVDVAMRQQHRGQLGGIVDAGAKGMDELLAATYDDVSRDMWQYAE